MTSSDDHLISVVVPAYNCGEYMKQAMDSILSQSYSHFEILVADDASNDDTRNIIDAYTDLRIRRFHNPVNLGYLKTCNRLFELCSGRYIVFQDADDWSEPRRFELLANALNSDPGLYAIGSAIQKVDAEGVHLVKRIFPRSYRDALNEMENRGKAACCGTIMFRREILVEIGGYREFFNRRCFEHVDWLYRIMERYPFENLPDALYYYRENPQSQTADFTPEKIVMREVVHILGQQRKTDGIDMLDRGQEPELEQIRKSLPEILLARDPYYFYKYRINRAILNRSGAELRAGLGGVLTEKWYRPYTYLIALVAALKLFLGVDRYYRWRDFLLPGRRTLGKV